MSPDIIQYIVLALIQGFTEFLPVSSSAHLILVPRLLGWADQGLAVDVAAHVGTLAAVVYYFRRELSAMLGQWYASGFSARDQQSRYVWYLVVATVPVAVAGLLAGGLIGTYLRSPLVLAWASILFGLLLWWADAKGLRHRTEAGLAWHDVIIIGLFQVLALIPGTSRSGITITAGLLLGFDRQAASRFAFLLSIPVIILAGGYEFLKLLASPAAVDWTGVVLVTVLSAVTAAITIHLFLKFLARTGMLPYVIYRLILGAVLLYLFT